MKKTFQTILLLAVLTAFTSCKRMPLYDVEKTMHLVLELKLKLDIDINIEIKKDLDIPVEDSIHIPEHNKVLFYSPSSEALLHTEFVDSTGGNISTPPGTYKMLVYSFGTEYVQIRGENSLSTIEAFTSDITSNKQSQLRGFLRSDDSEDVGPIIYPPDHLLVAYQQVVIPEYTSTEHATTIHTEAHTIAQTYLFEVNNITGSQYIQSCEAFVTNQARSCFFGRGELSSEPATLSFLVGINHKKGILYTTFNTFGKLPGESRSLLHLLIRDTGGKEYRITTDITKQFTHDNRHIIISDPIVIPEPESHGGGLDPSVNPWDEENHDVPIG